MKRVLRRILTQEEGKDLSGSSSCVKIRPQNLSHMEKQIFFHYEKTTEETQCVLAQEKQGVLLLVCFFFL